MRHLLLLERHAPQLRKPAWFWFKAWLSFCLLSTAITPPMPWLMPSPRSFDYP